MSILVNHRDGNALGFAMACSNTFGLVTGAFLLGFGMSEIPKSMWKNADWTTRQKVLSHKITKMAVKLDDAHQELSNAIVVSLAYDSAMCSKYAFYLVRWVWGFGLISVLRLQLAFEM